MRTRYLFAALVAAVFLSGVFLSGCAISNERAQQQSLQELRDPGSVKVVSDEPGLFRLPDDGRGWSTPAGKQAARKADQAFKEYVEVDPASSEYLDAREHLIDARVHARAVELNALRALEEKYSSLLKQAQQNRNTVAHNEELTLETERLDLRITQLSDALEEIKTRIRAVETLPTEAPGALDPSYTPTVVMAADRELIAK